MGRTKILVIEDEEDIIALIHYNLVKAGYAVDTATSGEEGLQKAAQFMPEAYQSEVERCGDRHVDRQGGRGRYRCRPGVGCG